MPSDLDKKKLAALVSMIEAFDQKPYVDRGFDEAVKALLEYVKKIRSQNADEIATINASLRDTLSGIQRSLIEKTTTAERDLLARVEDAINRVNFEHSALMAEAQTKLDELRDGEDGKDADEDEIVVRVLDRIPKPEVPQIDLSPLEGRINEKIKALDDKVSNVRTAPIFAPSRGIMLKVNGVKQGIINELNIVGSGVAITKVNGLPTLTITGGTGSGSTDVETPTGTVNGVNTAFTVVNEPLYIVVDGISRFPTTHYTYLAGNITITDGAPPTQYIRSIYSA